MGTPYSDIQLCDVVVLSILNSFLCRNLSDIARQDIYITLESSFPGGVRAISAVAIGALPLLVCSYAFLSKFSTMIPPSDELNKHFDVG